MDDERLKNPPVGSSAVPDYFDEMLKRIRDIRASELRVYLRVRDIFTMAADHEPTNSDTNLFFQIIQNKLHLASTGMTAEDDKANSEFDRYTQEQRRLREADGERSNIEALLALMD